MKQELKKLQNWGTKDIYEHWKTSHKIKIEEMNNLIACSDKDIDAFCTYLNFVFQKFTLPGGWKFEDFKTKSVTVYLTAHKDKHTTLEGRALIVKLLELKSLRFKKQQLIKKLKEEESYFISYKEFKFIIQTRHTEWLRLMIEEGCQFRIGKSLGYLVVEGKLNNLEKMVLNRGETSKRAKKILAEGKTLYSEENPTGERYKVFYIDDFFHRFSFKRDTSYLTTDPMANLYRFFYAKGNKNIMTQLYKHIRSNPLATQKYVTKNI